MTEYRLFFFFFFQAEDGIRDLVRSRGLGDVYKRQVSTQSTGEVRSPMPLQILPPLVIITGAFTLTGGGIWCCQRLFDGRAKHVLADEFDRLMVRRESTLDTKKA
eukprot:TRINITY_DN1681_c0_g1_i1.p1 TRINITY_DN1681_c0_g1~~TRINITY_DN1681_c0_g1_i1.p1  ORF type:complete len:105 (+),score=31.58 TRINITY_DN1681_c0_g1_i1:66-380(+)